MPYVRPSGLVPRATYQRTALAIVVTLVGLGALLALLLPFRAHLSVAIPALVFVLPALVGVVIGGALPGVVGALAGFLVYDAFFLPPYDALKAMKGMDQRMGVCIDMGHTVRTGTDVVRAVADAGPRLLDMHAKDLRDLKVMESQCIVGEGRMPIVEIFRQLKAMRYPGYVNLEYEIDADDPMPGMKQSFAYMRGVLAGLASADNRPR